VSGHPALRDRRIPPGAPFLKLAIASSAKRLSFSGMVKITGDYQGDLHCSAVHGPSGTEVFTDAPKDNQGRGEAFSPTDLVATAMATCIVTTMAIIGRKHGVELKGLRYEVTKEMSANAPRRIVRLATTLWMPIAKIHPASGALEHAAHHCPVHQSLHPDVEKPVVFHWSE
jgi:putative redox protein